MTPRFSALPLNASRRRTSSVMSASSTWVTWAVVWMDLVILSATIFLKPLTGTLSSFGLPTEGAVAAGCGGLVRAEPAAFLTSSSVILPVEPEPRTFVTSTPNSRASLRVAGVASTPSEDAAPTCLGAWNCWLTVAAGLAAASAGFEAVCWSAAPESITSITCPTLTVSPSFARIRDTCQSSEMGSGR